MKTRISLFLLLIFFGLINTGLSQNQDATKVEAQWNSFVTELKSNDPQRIVTALSLPPEFSEISTNSSVAVVRELENITKTYYLVPGSNQIAGMAIFHLSEMGPKASNSAPFLFSVLTNSAASIRIKRASFGGISSVSPNSPVEVKAIEYGLISTNAALFERVVLRFSSGPPLSARNYFIPTLVERLKSGVISNDWMIVQALGNFADESGEALAAVRKELSSKTPENRAAAVSALSRMNAVTEREVKIFGDFLSDEQPLIVRRNAIHALALAAPKSYAVIDQIEKAAKSQDARVASIAASIIEHKKAIDK